MNKLVKKISMLMCAIVMTLSSAVTVYAEDYIQTGGIAIETNVYTVENGERIKATASTYDEDYQPGQLVDYIVAVKNTAMDAYIRVRVDFESDYTVTHDVLRGISNKWVYKNGYYYYTEPVANGAEIELCDKIKLPDVSAASSSNSIGIDIKSQAIQAKNFTPDFTADEPWLNIAIEGGMTPGTIYSTNRTIKIAYDGNLKNAFDKQTVLDSKINAMPGDTITDTLKLKPSQRGTVTMRVLYGKAYPEEANHIRLKVYKNNKAIYSGPFFSDSLAGGISLGVCPSDSTTQLTYELIFDKNLTNKSAWMDIPVSFYFMESVITDEDDEPGDIIQYITYVINNDEPSETTPEAAVLGAIRGVPTEGVLGATRAHIKTGDEMKLWLTFLGAIFAGLIAIVTYMVMSVKKKQQKGGQM